MADMIRFRIWERRLDGTGHGSYYPSRHTERGEAIDLARRLTARYGVYCQYRVEAWVGDLHNPQRIVIIWNSIDQREYQPAS